MPGVKAGAPALGVVFWLAACGTDAPPIGPTLQLPFTSSPTAPVLFNAIEGVTVGTTGSYGFGALNAGSQSLVLQSVVYTGSPQMALQPFAQPLPATLSFDDEFIIGMTCTPLGALQYSGSVTLTSNAINTPDAVVYVSCIGVP